MIDCEITENFFHEYRKMCKSTVCMECGIAHSHNAYNVVCSEYIKNFPKEAIAIVQAWSDAHSPKTFLSDFLEKHPKAQLRENDIPVICAKYLGYTEKVDCSSDYQCVACWNTPLEDNE